MKVLESVQNDIPLKSMKDGDIAIITCWNGSVHIGKIVQRFGNSLVCLGKPSGNSWTDIFDAILMNESKL